jgi:hypothetical protein
MDRVTSKDGTSIAYQRIGTGPAVILVGGADRRRLGERAARPRAGRALHGVQLRPARPGRQRRHPALRGATRDKLAVYEVPYNLADDGPHWHRGDGEKAEALLAQGRRGEVVELFMRTVGSSEKDIAGARSSPFWPGLEALAHTLAYDAACVGDGHPPTARLATITRPTLVATGGGSPDAHGGGLPPDFFDQAADAIAASIPQAERLTIEVQGHVADPKAVAPVLERFFGA